MLVTSYFWAIKWWGCVKDVHYHQVLAVFDIAVVEVITSDTEAFS